MLDFVLLLEGGGWVITHRAQLEGEVETVLLFWRLVDDLDGGTHS
jgi:hypothetical protein